MVKNAPSYAEETEMDQAREWEVYSYYGIKRGKGTSAGQTEARIAEQQRGGSIPCASGTAGQESMVGKAQSQPGMPRKEEKTMQLSEEELKVGKRQVEAGGVRLRKIIRTETVNQPVELKREEIVVERVPAGEARAPQQTKFEGEEVYIPLRREEVVIEKEARVREEVRVRKETQTDRQEVSEQVRKEDVEIEETGEARRSDRTKPRPGGSLQEERPRSQRLKNKDKG
jgi:uncharacterized protein (TIGR02271 family)